MLFLVYLSIEESTSGVPEYNRGRKRSEVPAKQKSSLAGSLLLYLYSFVYCLLQLFQRLGQGGVRGTLPSRGKSPFYTRHGLPPPLHLNAVIVVIGDGPQKALACLLPGVQEKFFCGGFLSDDTVFHKDDAVGHVAGKAHLVGDDHQR